MLFDGRIRSVIAQQPLDVWTLAAVVLFLKMFAIALYQGRHRLTSKVFAKEEDAAYWGDGTVAERDLPQVERAQRALRNDLENIPMFLLLAFAYLLYDLWEQGAYIYIGLFVIARIVHTWSYLRPRQPLRNRAYLLGLLCTFAVAGHLVFEIFSPR
jgi:glutathione S-transferase